jgi:hypothetical protein
MHRKGLLLMTSILDPVLNKANKNMMMMVTILFLLLLLLLLIIIIINSQTESSTKHTKSEPLQIRHLEYTKSASENNKSIHFITVY